MRQVRLNKYDVINSELPTGSFTDSRYEELKGTIIEDKEGVKYLEVGKGNDRVLKFCWGVRVKGNKALKKIDIDFEAMRAEAQYLSRWRARR